MQKGNVSQNNQKPKGQMMKTNRFRNAGPAKPRQVRVPTLRWWRGIRLRSRRSSPIPYWDRNAGSPTQNRLRWKPRD